MFGLGAASQAVGGLFNIGTGIANYFQQKKQFEYQKQLNERIMQREDTAVQRRAEDLKNAGLSQTLAAGGAAATTSASSAPAPQMSESFGQQISNAGQSVMEVANAYRQYQNMETQNKSVQLDNAMKSWDLLLAMRNKMSTKDNLTLERYVMRQITDALDRGMPRFSNPFDWVNSQVRKYKDAAGRKSGSSAMSAVRRFNRGTGRCGGR